MIKRGLNLVGVATCNTALAVISVWYVVHNLGITVETDAFFASGALPQFVFLVLNATLLPVLVPLLATRDPQSFRDDAWTFFILITLIFGLLAIILYATSAVWVPLLVPGFSAAGKSLTISLTRIQLISMVLNASIIMLWTPHHARHRFVWVELSGVVANLAGLLFLFYALPRFGIRAAVWSAVLYNSLKFIFLLPILGRWRGLKWKSSTVKEAWHRFKPLLPGQVYLRSDPLVDRFLTSLTPVGSLSLLYVAQQAYASINVVLGKAVVAPMVPHLAMEAGEGAWRRYRRDYRSRLVLSLLLSCLGGLVLLLVGLPALRLVVGLGGMAGVNAEKLWLLLLALSGLLLGGLSGQITSGAFYAMGDTKTPTKASVFVYTIYIPLKMIITFRYGLIGLALTMSGFSVANFLVQFLTLEKTISRECAGETSPVRA